MCPVTDKAEGNKFAKDFEDSSLKLQEFISFLDKEMKTTPPLLEALGNADIFYEMQYKEVKIVANVSARSMTSSPSLQYKLQNSEVDSYCEDVSMLNVDDAIWAVTVVSVQLHISVLCFVIMMLKIN